ncbi:PQQ-dependent sugar dehydrogenase [Streptosporangium sp. NPDC051023]|uniref:PQQ-dependent sugar dehydrogenase n=1 Tax=Streptosporangium sp. NPDC051023 TaxID=3155410 RepID=UPI00344EE926
MALGLSTVATASGSPAVAAVTAPSGVACPSSGPGGTTGPAAVWCGGGVPSGIAQVSAGWSIPWGIAWLPGGRSALVTERDSFKVFVTTFAGGKIEVGTVPETVTTDGEGGLLGVAVDPRWTRNHYVYFMHTAAEGNRIARMTYDDDGVLGGYTVLVRGIAKNANHNGGRLAFGPDGYLYATTGDAQNPETAQNRDSLNGKILRMTTSGAPAPGNPFGTLVYSYGHRNPEGIAWDSRGRLWESELGNAAVDELNLIKPGLNYGWPVCEGTCDVVGMTNPKRTWPVSVASPSGIAIVRDVVYMAALRGQRLWRIPLCQGESTAAPTAYYTGSYGRLRTVTRIPGTDRLWLATSNGGQPEGSDRIFRITVR